MFTPADDEGYRELLDGVRMKPLAWGGRTLLAEFRLSAGASIPVHSHPQEQTGTLVSGVLEFFVAGERRVARAGDAWCLAPDTPHGVEVLEDAVVIEVFSPVREDYLAMASGDAAV